MTTRKRTSLNLYKSYMFKDKDPIIDSLRTAWSDSGDSLHKLHERSNVSTSTMRNWFNGSTRRPQFATVAAVAIACGKTGIELTVYGARLVERHRAK